MCDNVLPVRRRTQEERQAYLEDRIIEAFARTSEAEKWVVELRDRLDEAQVEIDRLKTLLEKHGISDS